MKENMKESRQSKFYDLSDGVRERIFELLYLDDTRIDVCVKRLINKEFRDRLDNVQVTIDKNQKHKYVYSPFAFFTSITDEKAFICSLEWMEEKRELLSLCDLTRRCALIGFTNALVWIKERKGSSCFNDMPLMNYAAWGGQINTLIWLHTHFPFTFTDQILIRAIISGRKHVVEWVLDNLFATHDPSQDLQFIDEIVTLGNFDTLTFLINKRPEWKQQCLNACLLTGQTELLSALI